MLKTWNRLNASASFWSVIYNGLRIGGNVITLPIALRTISQNDMGLYYSFAAVGGIAVFMDMGLGYTVARQVAYIYSGAKNLISTGIPECDEDGKPDMELFSKMVGTVRKTYLILGLTAAVLLMIPGGFFIGKNIISAGMSHSLIFAWLVYAASVAHSLGTGYWSNFLMGVRQERLSAFIGTASQAGYVALVLIGLLSGWGIWAYSIALLISGVAQRTTSSHYFIKITRVIVSIKPDFSMLKVFWPMSWRLWIVVASMYIFQKTSVIVSSKELGLDTTAGYGLVLSLFSIINQITRTPLFVKYPEISRLRVAGKMGEIRRLFFTRLYGYLAVTGIALMLFCYLGPTVLNLLGSKTHLPPLSILLVAAGFYMLDMHQGEYYTLVLSENKNPFIIPYTLTAVVSLVLMTLGAMHFGLMGLVVGQGISQMLVNNWWVVLRGWEGLRAT